MSRPRYEPAISRTPFDSRLRAICKNENLLSINFFFSANRERRPFLYFSDRALLPNSRCIPYSLPGYKRGCKSAPATREHLPYVLLIRIAKERLVEN
jgi:hypothetical protein